MWVKCVYVFSWCIQFGSSSQGCRRSRKCILPVRFLLTIRSETITSWHITTPWLQARPHSWRKALKFSHYFCWISIMDAFTPLHGGGFLSAEMSLDFSRAVMALYWTAAVAQIALNGGIIPSFASAWLNSDEFDCRTKRLGKSLGLFVWNEDVLLSPLFARRMDGIDTIIVMVFVFPLSRLDLVITCFNFETGENSMRRVALKVTIWETTEISQTVTVDIRALSYQERLFR